MSEAFVIVCPATLEVLTERFDSSADAPGLEQTFLRHRVAIEQTASDKYDAGEIEPHNDPKIVITARDMASPLSRKF
jgi:hypothetical protein